MTKHNPANERIKRRYFTYLKEAKKYSEPTVDAAAQALTRFEQYTGWRELKAFRIEQAVAFKRFMATQRNTRTGNPLSTATLYTTMTNLRRFFWWLADQPGFKSRIRYSDADYFNMSRKDCRTATARRDQPYPTLEQVARVITTMPSESLIERRNRAIVAFTILTGCRVGATASLKVKHVDVISRSVFLDAREVHTKFSKTFRVNFFDVGEEIVEIFLAWVKELREQQFWGNNDPLFPATETQVGSNHAFVATGLKREHWATSSPIRAIFRHAFNGTGLPYFHPHTFRRTLVALGEALCQTPEDFKAWSQNLAHDGVLTTFTSYGAVSPQRQAEILATLRYRKTTPQISAEEIAKAVVRELANDESHSSDIQTR